MFCRHCGKELPEGARFCTNCGATVDSVQQEVPPKPPQGANSGEEPNCASETIRNPVRDTKLKKAGIVVAVVIGVIVLGVFGVRTANESAMKQQIPQKIYNDSEGRVITHYDRTMAYPYGDDLGYAYGCDFTTFEFTRGDKPNTLNVNGKMEVIDKSQSDHPPYRIEVRGTVSTNFFRTAWSADWTLFFQDPIYR